jgi:glycosyltransferase involved in cell wall biosynthesis
MSQIRILIFYDEEGWAWWHRAHHIKKSIGGGFIVDIKKAGTPFLHTDYDIILLFEYYLFDLVKYVPRNKIIVGSSCPKTLQQTVDLLRRERCAAGIVNNRGSYEEVAERGKFYCCQNGVDHTLFYPGKNKPQELIGCWVGNSKSMGNKGLDLIRAACERAGVKLNALDQSEKNNGGETLTQEQVRDLFYHRSTVYICASEKEGTPNPALEAMACGLPVISTRVGNMPELIEDGVNGYLIDRTIDSIVDALKKIEVADLKKMSVAARTRIENGWSWKSQVKKYEKMLLEIHEKNIAVLEAAQQFSIGYSFCIITDGKRIPKLVKEIKSIQSLGIPKYEILITGELPDVVPFDGCKYYPLPDAARNGRLGEMRNFLCAKAQYDILVVADDDLIFANDFYEGMIHYGNDFDVLCVKLLNADGSRYWDWATLGGPRGHALLDYEERDPYQYVTGGLCIMKKWVSQKVRWDPLRGINQLEDVDFSRGLQAEKIRIDFNPMSTIIHNDWRLMQLGKWIVRTDRDLDRIADYAFKESWEQGIGFLQHVYSRLPGDSLTRMLCLFYMKCKSLTMPEVPGSVELSDKKLSHEIFWVAPFFNPSGYASEAISFVKGLEPYADLTINHNTEYYSEEFIEHLPQSWKDLLKRLHRINPKRWAKNFSSNRKSIVIHHQPGYGLLRFPATSYMIGRTMFETDRIPENWVSKCNEMDEIWVPSQFNVETFSRCGVKKEKLFVMPECIDTEVYDPQHIVAARLPYPSEFAFLSIFEWTNRKGWDVLLDAYFGEFTNSDRVCLYLRTNIMNLPGESSRHYIQSMINEFIEKKHSDRRDLPHVELMLEELPFGDLLRLYKAVDAFVLPSRGEGWGRPYMEAMAMELPVIATNWSGNTEFTTHENSYLIESETTEEIIDNQIKFYDGHRWAKPSITQLRTVMREIFSNPEEAKAKGKLARREILQKFSTEVVGEKVYKRLSEIEQMLSCEQTRSRSKESIPTIVWEGSQFVRHSLALINREMCVRLASEGVTLSLVPFEHDTYTPDAEDPAATLQRFIGRDVGAADIYVRHQWPPNLTPPSSGRWVVNQPWEFGALPKLWVEVFSTQVDEMWAVSNYVRDVYIASGIPAERVFVVPNGFDPKKFHIGTKPTKLKTKKKFKFLFVGGTIYRKGIDILIDAYMKAFTKNDDVCLVIKDMGGDSFYKGINFREKIAEKRKEHNAAEVEYIDTMLSDEKLAGLYTACDVYVHPYRGEGFGLPILEAMACSIPAIVPNGGACLDFCNENNSLFVTAPKRYHSEKRVGDYETTIVPWLLEPSVDDLQDKMKYAESHRSEMKELGKRAYDDAHARWTWDHAYAIMKQRIAALMMLPILRSTVSTQIVQNSGIAVGQDVEPIIQRAEQFLEEKKFDDAVNLLTQVVKQNPKNIDALNDLAVAAMMMENYPAASNFLSKVMELDPANEIAIMNLQYIIKHSTKA